MQTRNFGPGSAALLLTAATAFVACGPSRNDNNDAGVDGGGPPQVCLNCPPRDGGTDGGNTGGDGGTPDGGGGGDGGCVYDGGLITTTLGAIRQGYSCEVPFGAHVQVSDVVVHTVSYSATGSQGDSRADFWVTDPANPTDSIWVSKFYTDEPGPYLPAPGDQITIDGYVSTISKFENPTGYRRQIAARRVNSSTFLPLTLTKTGEVPLPEPQLVEVGQFGNADGGWSRPNPELAGTRVYVQGPVEIVDATPRAFQRVSADPDDPRYYGFELQGGILVSNSKTFANVDGGCPWRDIAADAGANGEKVVFTQGVYGVWDTYTFASCADGGTDIFNCFSNEGKVPGTSNDYTYVLYPQTCEDFVGGEVQPQ